MYPQQRFTVVPPDIAKFAVQMVRPACLTASSEQLLPWNAQK